MVEKKMESKKIKYLQDYTEEDWDKLNSDLDKLPFGLLEMEKIQVETLLHYTNAGINPGTHITLGKRLAKINRLLRKNG